MSYEEENIKKVLNEYELLRTKAENRRDKYVAEIYKKYTRLEEIKDEINSCGFENTKKIMANPQKSKEYNEEFNKKLKKLQDEKKKLLKENNIPYDFEQPIYNCCVCNDTGYVENKKCVCFKEKLIKQAYLNSNLGNSFNNHDFDLFSLDYYSSRLRNGEDLSDRENMKQILKECTEFCKNFDEANKNIFMIGKPGLGKTFLSNCMAKEVLNQGKTVMYMRATNLFSSYEDYRFGRKKEIDFNIERLYNSDLLIIDDLGTENITKVGISFFFDFLNDRIDKNRKTIINTNFSMAELSKVYTARITSRIYEFFTILHFKGDDIRIQKLK